MLVKEKRLFESIYRIRRVEMEISRVYSSDVVKSPIHLSIGQEYISVGICDVLEKKDIVFGTYRGHALYLAKGGNLNKMMAELYGKSDGCCKGKGGSMHLADKSVNMMGTSAIVASSIPEAVGYALAIQYKSINQVVVCFFGDGATNEGVFHESLNFASLKKLPILFVCENNNYAIHSRTSDRSAQPDLYKYAELHNISASVVTKCNIMELRDIARNIINNIKDGSGPHFLEVFTYRWMEHVGPDYDWSLGYRLKHDMDSWKNDDPVEILGGILPKEERLRIEQMVNREVYEAMSFADKSPFPNSDELYKDVYE